MTFFSRCKDRIWPEITHAGVAEEAARQGFWAATFCAVVTAILSILGYLGIQILENGDFDLWALLDAAIWAIIAWRIRKISRIAAIAGLAFYVFQRIDMWLNYGPRNPVIAIILTLMFINSIRGTFAYHKFVKGQSESAMTKGGGAVSFQNPQLRKPDLSDAAMSEYQARVNSILRWGIVFSLVWLAGIGSAISLVLAFKARKIIRESGGQVTGRGKTWFCFIVGGFGLIFWLAHLAVIISR